MQGSLRKALAAIAVGVVALAADTAVAVPPPPDPVGHVSGLADPSQPTACEISWRAYLAPASTTAGPGGTIVEDGTYYGQVNDVTNCASPWAGTYTSLRGPYHAVLDPTGSVILDGGAQLSGTMAANPVRSLDVVFDSGAATLEGSGSMPGLLDPGKRWPTAIAGAANVEHSPIYFDHMLTIIGAVTITPSVTSAP